MVRDRTYKGYTIVKQRVGPMGWNIVDPRGRCVHTGVRSLADAKAWISFRVEGERASAEWLASLPPEDFGK
jgi:hypothetical protein